MKIKRSLVGCIAAIALCQVAMGTIEVTSVTARQRYPWNGKVDVVVTMTGASNDVAECAFVATNKATGSALSISHIADVAGASGSNSTWSRKFVWDATADLGEVTIERVSLAVNAEIMPEFVQLWDGGPYWATCNIGANKPEEYGYYFWWGDTVGYKRNATDDGWISVKDGSSFEFNASNCPTYNKNDSWLQSEGYIDSSGNLTSAHDAATAHLGSPWRLPTYDELVSLIDNCDTTWTTRNGVNGRLVRGKGEYRVKSIFLPAAEYGVSTILNKPGNYGYYWTSTVISGNLYRAWYIDITSDRLTYINYWRYYGYSVRPVRGSAQ